MPMNTELHEWTADELVAELKRRDRGDGHKAAGGTRVVQRQRGTRNDELAQISTDALARAAQDRQRVIYGVDDRKDLYEVMSVRVKKAASSVVALVKTADLTQQGDASFSLATSPYQQQYS